MIYVDENENIHMYKGDTGNLQFKNLPTDRNYTAYFSIVNPDNGKIIKEVSKATNNQDTIVWSFGADFTDNLKVESGEETQIYKYGFKVCYGSEEITLIPKVKLDKENPVFQPAPDFVIHMKYIEGVQ